MAVNNFQITRLTMDSPPLTNDNLSPNNDNTQTDQPTENVKKNPNSSFNSKWLIFILIAIIIGLIVVCIVLSVVLATKFMRTGRKF